MKKEPTRANPPASQLPTAYQEALRYMANAKETIIKAGVSKLTGDYDDIKYVKTAAGTAYSGVLLAVDAYLKEKEGPKFKKPTSIEDYRIRLAKVNRKMLQRLNEAYDELHLAGYYHGTPSRRTIQNGFKVAFEIIEQIKA